jgi:hypothetical protein
MPGGMAYFQSKPRETKTPRLPWVHFPFDPKAIASTLDRIDEIVKKLTGKKATHPEEIRFWVETKAYIEALRDHYHTNA